MRHPWGSGLRFNRITEDLWLVREVLLKEKLDPLSVKVLRLVHDALKGHIEGLLDFDSFVPGLPFLQFTGFKQLDENLDGASPGLIETLLLKELAPDVVNVELPHGLLVVELVPAVEAGVFALALVKLLPDADGQFLTHFEVYCDEVKASCKLGGLCEARGTWGGTMRSGCLPLIALSIMSRISACSCWILGFFLCYSRLAEYSSLLSSYLLRILSSWVSQTLASSVLKAISRSSSETLPFCLIPTASAQVKQVVSIWYLIQRRTFLVLSRESGLALTFLALARQLMAKQRKPRAPPATRYFHRCLFLSASIVDSYMIPISNHNQTKRCCLLIIQMFGPSCYDPFQLPSLDRHSPPLISFRPHTSCTSERTLLVSILHMFLGMPSPSFSLHGDTFSVGPDFPDLLHLHREVLQRQLERLAVIGNSMQSVRLASKRLRKCQQKILQSFGMGLSQMQKQIEQALTQKLLVVHQEEGEVGRTQQEMRQSRNRPSSLLSLTSSLSPESTKLALLSQILAQLPVAATHEQLERSSIFLLNFYFKQCQLQYLSESQFQLHAPFRQALAVYVDICKAWVAFSVEELQSFTNCGFFLNLGRALAMDGDRFFDVGKIISPQLIPQLFAKSYKRIIELGKTVQFIKLYFNQQDLLLFHQFLDIDQEFLPIHRLLAPSLPHTRHPPRKSVSISARCSVRPKNLKITLQRTEDNPFGIFDSSPAFLQLRSLSFEPNPSLEQEITCREEDEASFVSNLQMAEELELILSRVALKCKIVLKQKKIKESIEKTLRGIKNFVLLGQGDFIHEFIELSEAILEKSTQKIPRSNVERIIEEAVKASSQAPLYEQIKDSISHVFLRSEGSMGKGWKTFSLSFRSEKPVSFIFNIHSMRDYESIGNLLFRLRYCEHSFVAFWKKSMRTSSKELLKTRLAIQRFLSCLSTYLFSQVQEHWNKLLETFQDCDSILAFLEANEVFLSELKKETVQSRPLCNSMLSLVRIVQKLESMGRRMEADPSYPPQTQIELVWSWFLSLMDQARLIPQLSDSFDFNFNVSGL